MKLETETSELSEYLAASEVIDYEDENIQAVGRHLSTYGKTEVEFAKAAYEYVRDRIPHSCDIQGKTVTWKASKVLSEKEGICYAKSHLLAAILRSQKIPTGFCYQKLVFDDSEPSYLTLHGLNAIYLESIKRWIRVDARGNKPGVNAEFSLDREALAFPVRENWGEIDYQTIYTQPNKKVVSALKTSNTLEELLSHLPTDL